MVSRQNLRNNNNVEAWNSVLKKKIHVHPNPWDYLHAKLTNGDGVSLLNLP